MDGEEALAREAADFQKAKGHWVPGHLAVSRSALRFDAAEPLDILLSTVSGARLARRGQPPEGPLPRRAWVAACGGVWSDLQCGTAAPSRGDGCRRTYVRIQRTRVMQSSSP